jgi:hypothetical protein
MSTKRRPAVAAEHWNLTQEQQVAAARLTRADVELLTIAAELGGLEIGERLARDSFRGLSTLISSWSSLASTAVLSPVSLRTGLPRSGSSRAWRSGGGNGGANVEAASGRAAWAVSFC